jgi:hypothetical protein
MAIWLLAPSKQNALQGFSLLKKEEATHVPSKTEVFMQLYLFCSRVTSKTEPNTSEHASPVSRLKPL